MEGKGAVAGKVRPSVTGKGSWAECGTPGASLAAVRDQAQGGGEMAGEVGAGQRSA